MNILIDTNILIPLEDTGRELDPRLAEMRRLSDQNGSVLNIHPLQNEEIARDRDEERREIVLSRLKQSQKIPSPPELTETQLKEYGWTQNNENERIDNLLLHSVCQGAVHFLVTNDRKIHANARKVGFQEHVHDLDQIVIYLRTQTQEEEPPPPGIQQIFLHEIDVHQPFFDSLRNSYSDYNTWYQNKALERRKAWCVSENQLVDAICIYKLEESPEITDSVLKLNGSTLKLCTFKVGESVRGRKLGERLLHCAFKYAVEKNIAYVYLHIFGEQHKKLVLLCEDYGFQAVGKYKRDVAYLKDMSPPESLSCEFDPLTYAIKYYPNYLDRPAVKKFIVPIRPRYHEKLFPDVSSFATGLFSGDPSQYTSESNTIKKAYICHSNITKIRPGDLLLFYRGFRFLVLSPFVWN